MAVHLSRFACFRIAAVLALLLHGPAFASDLDDAVRAGNVDHVELLLTSGADPNKRSPYDSPLHLASRLGFPDIVAELVKAGADVELPGYGGARPLHAAVLAGQAKAASALLERGAKVDALNNIGRTPLLSYVSGMVGDLATLKVLLEHGADANLPDGPVRFRALDHAAMQGRVDVADILIAFGADMNAKDNMCGKTPLQLAIKPCKYSRGSAQEMAQLLIDRGAHVNARSGEGLTALDYAKRYAPNNHLLQHLLIKAGAK